MKLRSASFALVLAACSVGTLDLAGKACPCADGFVCDTAANVCVAPSSLETPGDAGAPDDFVPQGDASGAITVFDLVARWRTANGIRWEWKATGVPSKLARYEVVTGPRAADVRARASSTRVFDPTTNPELGVYGGRTPDAGPPVSLWTVTDGHKEGEIVFAQVVAWDTDGAMSVSDVASDSTMRPRAQLAVFDDARPDGGVLVPGGGATKIVNDDPFAGSSCLEHTTDCGSATSCAVEPGVESIDGVNADAIQVTEFPDAFLELAVRGTRVAGSYVDVILEIGGDACGDPCRMRFNGLSFGATPADWRLLQIPLSRFKGADGTGNNLTQAQLSNRKRIAAFLVHADQPAGAVVGLDQVRIRW